MNDSREVAMQDVSSQQINNLADLIGIMAIEHPLQINDLSNRINGMIFQHSLNVIQYDIMEVDEVTELIQYDIMEIDEITGLIQYDIIIVDEITELIQCDIMETDEITEQMSDGIRTSRKRKYEEFIAFDIEVPEKRQRSK